MKKQFYLALVSLGLSLSVVAQGTSGAQVTSKKGGSASAGNHKVEAAKVDKKGVDIKGKNGGGVQIGKKSN
jgi:hypothetical protein